MGWVGRVLISGVCLHPLVVGQGAVEQKFFIELEALVGVVLFR